MAFSLNLTSGKCIFAAQGTNLKVTSVKIPAFEAKIGHCELREIRVGTYIWNVFETKTKRRKTYKFKAGKSSNINFYNREEQFTIVIKYNDDTTQLLGKFDRKEDITLLMNTIDTIKAETITEDKWLCASKENILKDNNTKENNTPLPAKSQMTGVMERSKTLSSVIKQPLRDKSPMRSVIGKNSLSLKSDTTPTKGSNERTPLGDKQGPVLKNKTQTRLFPLPAEKSSAIVLPDDDGDIKITAFGGSKSSTSFYGERNTPEKPKIRHTYSRKVNNSLPNDTVKTKLNSTLNNWSFRERDDLLRIPKENNIQSPSVVGFSNLGNTCYMNSILQCLLNIPTFFQDLNNIDNLELVQHNSLYNSLCNLGILKYSYETLENQRFALQRVKSAISNAATRFSGHAQQDAHELLCQCLDQLKEDLLSESKKRYEAQGAQLKIKELEEDGCHNCPIKSNFESTILHSITCEGCGEKVTKEEVCHDFSLVIPDFDENTNPEVQTLVDLLQMYFDREMIEYSCEKCKGSYSVLSHHFSKLPRVLIIHIKRYDINDVKKTDRISIPKSINLSAHMNSSTKSVPKFIYDKDKLKARGETEYNNSLNTAEKRKSPGQLDSEPLQKHTKSTSIYTSNDELKELQEDYLVPALCEKPVDENKENTEANGEFLTSEIDDESLVQALNEDNFTKVKPSNSKDISTTVQNQTIEILPDEHEDNSAIGIYTSVLDDEEEELKRALDLSMKEYEKSQIESFKEYEQIQSLDSKSPPENEEIECVTNEGNDVDNLYMLVGIVNHHGQNTGTGHYTSDSFDFKSKKWRCYNDSSVKEITQHDVRFGRSQSAYIVFYMHNQCYGAILEGQ